MFWAIGSLYAVQKADDTMKGPFLDKGMQRCPWGQQRVWPGAREVVARAVPEMCSLRLWTGTSQRAWRRTGWTGKSSEVHDKRMSRRAILLGHRACSERN